MTAAECVAGSVRDLLSSTLMTRRKKHGWLKTMLGLMLGCMLVVVAVFAATNVATIATTKDRIVEPQAAVGFDADAIVVLGASVFADGTPSGILRDRLDDGIALYKEGVAPKLIMSGDNRTVSYNEVQVMKDYAISQGVPSYDIFCDHAGFSTYESMYRAKHVFARSSTRRLACLRPGRRSNSTSTTLVLKWNWTPCSSRYLSMGRIMDSYWL